jgi:hypothetical protein
VSECKLQATQDTAGTRHCVQMPPRQIMDTSRGRLGWPGPVKRLVMMSLLHPPCQRHQ